jgi:hypothetical protein
MPGPPLAASRLRDRIGVKLEWPLFNMRHRIVAHIGDPHHTNCQTIRAERAAILPARRGA